MKKLQHKSSGGFSSQNDVEVLESSTKNKQKKKEREKEEERVKKDKQRGEKEVPF